MINNRYLVIILLILLIISFQSRDNGLKQFSDKLPNLVNADVVFMGQNMFKSVSISDYVRIVKGNIDLGHKTLPNGALDTSPGERYTFYFFMNNSGPSTNYYVDIMDYVAPVQESTDYLIGYGCEIDTKLIFSVKNQAGQTQTKTSNAESLTVSESKDLTIRVGVHDNKCYGNPESKIPNTLCFLYNSSALNIEAQSPTASISSAIAKLSLNHTNAKRCFALPLLQDRQSEEITITITGDSLTEPTSLHNISVLSDDVNVDLNKQTLQEIWGYEDESGNNLGAPYRYLGKIYIT